MLGLTVATTTLAVLGAVPAHAAETPPADEVGPPQPEAVVMTRVCEDNGALVAMNNFGGGSVTFNVLVDNEATATYDVGAGAQASVLAYSRIYVLSAVIILALVPLLVLVKRSRGGADAAHMVME